MDATSTTAKLAYRLQMEGHITTKVIEGGWITAILDYSLSKIQAIHVSVYSFTSVYSLIDAIFIANDISRGTYGIAKVRTTLAGAYNIMAAAMYMHATYISARRERRYVRLQDRVHPEDMSILSSVMGVTQEVSVTDMKPLRDR